LGSSLRHDLRTRVRGGGESRALAEEVRVLGFTGAPDAPTWLRDEQADQLLDLVPSGNVLREQAEQQLERVVAGLDHLQPALERLAATRAADLAAEHARVRDVADLRGRTTVVPQLPVDVLGIYVFLPVPVA
jgi:hypothetical protein